MGTSPETRTTDRWRLILGEASSPDLPCVYGGATNMALDQVLLDAVAAGAPPVMRLYRWSPATLSFGRNQPASDLYDVEAAAARGIAFVRRPTGGQAVLHDDELTYAVVAPVGQVGKPRAAYRRINEALVAALLKLGVEAEISSGPAEAAGAKTWTDACFRHPERGEVVVRGRKLVGSAQRTESRTLLQHGSILLGGSQLPAEELLLRREGGADEVGWTTLQEELGRRPGMREMVESLVTAFEATLGIALAPSTLTSRERAGMEALQERFGSAEWTWRR